MTSQTPIGISAIYLVSASLLIGCNGLKHPKDHSVSPWIQSVSEQNFSAHLNGAHRQSNLNWYLDFNEPDLNHLIERGLSENLEIAQALSRLTQARLGVKVSAANLYPDLDSNLTLGSSRDNRDTVPSWNDSKSLGLQLSWEIDLFKRLGNRKAASLAQFKASQWDLDATRLLISAQIARLYFDILEHQALIELIEAQIATNEQFLELTQLRKSTGQGSILDVQQQEQQLLTSVSQLPEAKTNLKQLRRSLNILLGASPITTPDLVLHLKSGEVLPHVSNERPLPSVRQLLEQLPSLKAAHMRLAVFDLEAAIAAANRLPKVSLSASYSRTRADSFDPITGVLTNLTLNLTQPLFNAGRLKRTQKIREAEYQEAIEAFKLTFLSTLSDVEQASDNKAFRIDRLSNTQKRLKLAQKNVAEAEFQYANGLTDYLNVLVSLTTLQPLEVQYLQDQGRLLDAHVQLALATGGPLQPTHGRSSTDPHP